MAVEDFGGTVLGKPVDVVAGDLQNKTDVGAAIARRWYDLDKVDAILGLGHSGVAIAVHGIAREKNKIDIVTAAGSTDLTGKFCSPNGLHWVYDTYALSNGTATAVMKQGGAESWFFLTADYAFGHSLERDAAAVVKRMGGQVVGQVRSPLNNADFSSFLLQAQTSGAKVIGLANAGADTINAIKQASEFGLMAGGQRLAGLLVLLTDIQAIGLQDAQGLLFTEAFYWDQNDGTRAFSKRFEARHGKPPTMFQAGIYSAATHYLKAIREAGTRRDPGRARGDAQAPGRRLHDEERHDPGGRPDDARHVPARGQEAVGVEEPVGPDEGRGHHPGRAGLPAAGGRRVPPRREVRRFWGVSFRKADHQPARWSRRLTHPSEADFRIATRMRSNRHDPAGSPRDQSNIA